MKLFHWDKKLETGIHLLDQQHHQIIEKSNSFLIQHKCGKEREASDKCLDFLKQYILYHFQAEEAFMVKCGYPEYARHQALHNSLTTQVKFFTIQLHEWNYSEQVMSEFYEFLCEWVEQHILQEDLAFSRFYLANQKDEA